MRRLFHFLFLFFALTSCLKKEKIEAPSGVIPDEIYGIVYEFNVTPLNMTTPDKGFLLILMNNTPYRVAFNATDRAQSNAVMYFATDTILTNESREIANVGKDAVVYNQVKENELEIRFNDGRRVLGLFDPAVTSFGGTFGEQVIAQWRDPNDPAKPNQKARDDIRNLIHRYADKDGPGPNNTPVYLSVTVSIP